MRYGKRKMLINGEWTEGDKRETFLTINPANREALAEVARGNDTDILCRRNAKDAYRPGRDLRPGSLHPSLPRYRRGVGDRQRRQLRLGRGDLDAGYWRGAPTGV